MFSMPKKVGILIAVALILLPAPSHAATIAELQAQLQILMAQIALMQKGASSAAPPAGGAAGSCPNLSRNLSRGSRGTDVTQLQQFLVSQKLLSTDAATGLFGPLTEAAVKKFQCKTMNLCAGSPASNGYGAVGARTRVAITASCKSQPLQPQQQITTAQPPTSTPAPQSSSNPSPVTSSPQTPTPATLPTVTPTATCTPLPPQTQTISCPAGQTGSITQTRTSSCATREMSPMWSGWGTTRDTCTTIFPTGNITVSAPVLVITNNEITNPPISRPYVDKMIDSSITTFSLNGNNYWMNSNAIYTAKYFGTIDAPFRTLLWSKPTEDVFVGAKRILDTPDGLVPGYWIVNNYQDANGILGIVHTEHPKVTGGTYSTGRTRIGLSWSSDMGEHYTYLGDIIIPFTDPVDNIQGAPYIIKDGYMYLYFSDKCNGNSSLGGPVTVARANLEEVLGAAKLGRVSQWQKYLNGSWTSPGLGGDCSAVIIGDGINHTDAAYSTYTGKYYFLLSSMNWGSQATGPGTWIKMYESIDGINWVLKRGIVNEAPETWMLGYQYVSIVDASGSDNGTVGQKFYVFSAKDVGDAAKVRGYRWTVDLHGSADGPALPPAINSLTTNYSAIQESYQWSYLFGVNSLFTPMTWGSAPWDSSTKLWKGNEDYLLIGRGWFHPGSAADAVLRWKAPRSGIVRIVGTVLDGNGTCGNGILASILRNGAELAQYSIANGDSIGKAHDLSEQVASGDNIYFVVKSNGGDNACDTTNWNPTIEFL
jgi:peptidoglycan hydrolase-like protein with peptidoglycan-binding domain